MVKMSKGQIQFNFATDLEKLLKVGPNHLDMMGIGYGGFSWWHHLGALMVVACFSDLEAALGKNAWHKHNVHEEEFEALRHIRNAYVHASSDLSKIKDTKGLAHVQGFLAKLVAGKVTGIRGKDQIIDPYFQLQGSVVQLQGNTIRRMRSLYLQLMTAAGKIQQ
jgi:hypothetical protein